ncbi:MAG: putative ABC transporter permease [Clostridia bacterium]|nr:putative ABC transporter permease [Clostridia bacterium]
MDVFMKGITTFAYLFLTGSLIGWVIELFYRRFVPNRKTKIWVNPGFLTGPYLPIYGFGLSGLYYIKLGFSSFLPEGVWGVVLTLVFMVLAMTLIEYVGGIIFIKGMGIKLWDYSNQWGNIQGIICPLYSFFWGVIAVAYYFLLDPYVGIAIDWQSLHMEILFFVGLFGGVFLVDLWRTLDLTVRIRKFAKENKLVVKYEELKESFIVWREENQQKRHFLRFFSKEEWKEGFSHYVREQKDKMEQLKKKGSVKFSSRKNKK